MKLRYYMRGLAVGILVTTMIFVFSGRKESQMSDAQIRNRALELGMVDGSKVTLANLQKESEPESSTESEPESIAESESSTEPEPESPAESENSTESESSTESELESSVGPESNTEPEMVPVTIVIQKGASSDAVSKRLAAEGLVEDAAAFDAYLCKNGYAQKIRVGTYEILPGTSQEEIARMIAK